MSNNNNNTEESTLYHIDFGTGRMIPASDYGPYPIGTKCRFHSSVAVIVENGTEQDVAIYERGGKTMVTHGDLEQSGGWSEIRGDVATPEEVEALKAMNEVYETEQAAKRKAADEKRKADKAAAQAVLDKAPSWAVSVLVAELEENQSCLYTDYHGSQTVRSIALCYSKHNRNLFSEMRKAAKLLPMLGEHTPIDEWTENRQNYSMGGGMFLSESEYGRYSGWKIRKTSLAYCTQALIDPLAFPQQQSATKSEAVEVTEATYQLNDEKNGIEIMFPGKPSEEVRNKLKGARFRWSRRQGLWYAKQSPERLELAKQLCG